VIPLILLLLATAGCGGCDSQQTAQQQSEAEQKKKKRPTKKDGDGFEIKPLLPLVGQALPPSTEAESSAQLVTSSRLLVKPGHWMATTQELKTKYEDFVGQSTTTLIDAKLQPTIYEHTNFIFHFTRPVALAKGRAKRLEGELFIPEQTKAKHLKTTFQRNTGTQRLLGQPLLQKMPSYQYFLVVLSEEIAKYSFLQVTDAVRMPWEEELEATPEAHYRVVLADAKQHLPLPGNPLTWSSIAYLFWDEVDPERLSPQQQLALVDWLHWGGRLIISGPDSLDTLRGSFLADYLPALNAGPRVLTTQDLNAWSTYWSRRDRGQHAALLKPTRPWSGIVLKPSQGAVELAGGGALFYERSVGQGTVVVSAVQLTGRELVNWPGYDSFINAALLRRPRRIFQEGPYGDPRVTWADQPELRLDAHLATPLRLFARDAHTLANQQIVTESAQELFGQAETTTTTQVDRIGGLGTWNHFNPVSRAARDVLTAAAAVRVPGAGFVLGCLGIYLMALVPINWIVFRAVGRVEWAWIAAPGIALVGTLLIVRQAQLDIGFVRSQTEVAVLELQGSHPRGLLSRYTALYSSLSTTYDVTFDSSTTVATPFPASQVKRKSADETLWDVALEKQKQTRLSGLAVSSASTKMLRSEEIFSLAGPLQLGQSSRGQEQLENRTGYDLRDVVVVKRIFTGSGPAQYKSSWLGELRNGGTSVVGFQPLVPAHDRAAHAQQRELAASSYGKPKVDVEQLLKIALQFPADEDPRAQHRDECRVVGLIDQVLPGTEIAPAASQIVGATVVLAHLQYGDLPQPEPDMNSRSDVVKKATAVSSNN